MPDRHPDAQELAEYVDGVLPPVDRDEMERHLADCDDCRTQVRESLAFAAHASRAQTGGRVRPFPPRWVRPTAAGLAAAAVLVLGIRVVRPEWLRLGPATHRPELRELIAALANEPTRPVEGRLTGGFNYGSPPLVVRGPGDPSVSPEVRIVAGRLKSETDMDGIADLVVGQVDAAIDELNQAATNHPRAETFSDLSAAYLRRFVRQGRTPDAEAARSMAERAISASPTLAEPYFNRAWALEALKRNDDAVSAWRQYLTVDGTSLWADEARRHLDDLARAR